MTQQPSEQKRDLALPTNGEWLLDPAKTPQGEKQMKAFDALRSMRNRYGLGFRDAMARVQGRFETSTDWTDEKVVQALGASTCCVVEPDDGDLFIRATDGFVLRETLGDGSSSVCESGQGMFINADTVEGISGMNESLVIQTSRGRITFERGQGA